MWWQAEEEKKQRQRARLEALAEAEASKKAEQEAMDVAQSRVGPAVEKWAAAAGVVKKVKRGMAAPKYAKVLRLLLTTLHTVDHINVAEIKLDANASGGALKKSYFKVRADERPKHARRVVVVVVADCCVAMCTGGACSASRQGSKQCYAGGAAGCAACVRGVGRHV